VRRVYGHVAASELKRGAARLNFMTREEAQRGRVLPVGEAPREETTRGDANGRPSPGASAPSSSSGSGGSSSAAADAQQGFRRPQVQPPPPQPPHYQQHQRHQQQQQGYQQVGGLGGDRRSSQYQLQQQPPKKLKNGDPRRQLKEGDPCERCGAGVDGSYVSGRFCNISCAGQADRADGASMLRCSRWYIWVSAVDSFSHLCC